MSLKKFYSGIKLEDTGCVFKISKDHLLAWVERVNKENIVKISGLSRDVIKESGISFGILNPYQLNGDKLIIAKGIEPEPGVDGKIEIVTKSFIEKKADGLIKDPKNLGTIHNVSKGEIIARKIPPTPGKPGKDIFGNVIEPKPGEWVPFKPGNLVEIVNGDTLVASRSGALSLEDDGTISVSTQWTIKGDVDITTGHVEFYGEKLVVKGSVHGGFTVEAMGDVIIEGNIEDEAIILAGGDVFVNGLIRSQNTMVKTGGSLECGALEYSRLFIGKDLTVRNYVLNGICQVHGSAYIRDEKGLVAGGKVMVGGSIEVKNAGTNANVPTVLSAGHDPLLLIHHESLIKEQETLARKLAKIKEGLLKIQNIEKTGQGLDARLDTIKKNLHAAAIEIANQMDLNKEKIRKIEKDFGLMEKATVSLLDSAFPNVEIRICNASIKLRRPVEKIMFFFKKGEIGAQTIN